MQKLDLNSGGSERPPKQISFRGSELRPLGAGTVGATDFPRSNTVLERPPKQISFRANELRPLGHGNGDRSWTTRSATDFIYLFFHKIGVQLAHRQPPGLADRLCLLHTGICWCSQLQLAHRYPSGLADKLCLLQLTVIQTNNLLALRSNQHGGDGRGTAK